MAAAPPPAPNPDEVARQAVARACDALITRQQLFSTFDEKVGAADFARWRKDLIAYVASAGQDFVSALLFRGVIPAPPQYGDALVSSQHGYCCRSTTTHYAANSAAGNADGYSLHVAAGR